MSTLDEQIMNGEMPQDPGILNLPDRGESYYGDARRAGLDHAAACRRAYRDMTEATRSAMPILERRR